MQYYDQMLKAEQSQLHLQKTVTAAEVQETENLLAADFRQEASRHLEAIHKLEKEWNNKERGTSLNCRTCFTYLF